MSKRDRRRDLPNWGKTILRDNVTHTVKPERTVVVEGNEPYLCYHDPDGMENTRGMTEMTEVEARREHQAVPCHGCFKINRPTTKWPYLHENWESGV